MLVTVANAAEQSVYHDSIVTVVQERHLTINPHSDQPLALVVAGKRFRGVIGSAPYYARIDGGRRILFATFHVGWSSDKLTLVLLDIQTGRTQQLDFSDHQWGFNLHSSSPTLRDTIEQRSDGTLFLTSRSFDTRREYACSAEPFRLLRSQTSKAGKLVIAPQ
jgi:hypothetical protein